LKNNGEIKVEPDLQGDESSSSISIITWEWLADIMLELNLIVVRLDASFGLWPSFIQS
jgi:hypothetical protein